MPLDKQSNVANIHHAPGYQQYKLFLQQAQMEDDVNDNDPVTLEAMSTNIVSDSESDDEQSEASDHPDDKDWNTDWDIENNEDSEGAPRTVTFDLSPDDGATSETHVAAPDKEDHVENLAAEL